MKPGKQIHFYVSPGQINAQVPDLPVSSGTAQFTVATAINNNDCTSATPSAPQAVPLGALSPGLLTSSGGQGTVVAQHSADYSVIQESSPAKPGEVILLYGTGFGVTTPAIAAGQIVNATYRAASPLTVTIGGVTLAPTDILFAGLTPGFAGLWQFNLLIPTGLTAGPQPIAVAVGGVATQKGTTIPFAP